MTAHPSRSHAVRLSPALLAGVVLAAIAATVATVILLGQSSGPRGSLDDRVTAVAAQLKCTSCQAESVAASQSDIAQGMRAQIRDQLRAGRSPGQIKEWFAERYGASVLLDPPARGPGLALWMLPAVALIGGLGAVFMVTARRRPAPADEPPDTGTRRRAPPLMKKALVAGLAGLAIIAAVVDVVPRQPWRGSAAANAAGSATGLAAHAGSAKGHPMAAQPPGAAAWLNRGAALESKGSYAAAAAAYQHALRGRPGDAAIRIRLAFVLIRAGQPRSALPYAKAALRGGEDRADALLVLGLAERACGQRAAWPRTLRQFLQAAPHHPAAPAVRRLLRAGAKSP